MAKRSISLKAQGHLQALKAEFGDTVTMKQVIAFEQAQGLRGYEVYNVVRRQLPRVAIGVYGLAGQAAMAWPPQVTPVVPGPADQWMPTEAELAALEVPDAAEIAEAEALEAEVAEIAE